MNHSAPSDAINLPPRPDKRVRAFLSLGSNLGDRRAHLHSALQHLSRVAGVEITRASSVYETAPLDYVDQPLFLNQVLEVFTTLSPHQLLAECQTIEQSLGRKRASSPPKGPRPIDIDILLYGDQRVEDGSVLTIPHPRMRKRRFVLEPLAELAPDLVIVSSVTVQKALETMRGQEVRRINDG